MLGQKPDWDTAKKVLLRWRWTMSAVILCQADMDYVATTQRLTGPKIVVKIDETPCSWRRAV